MSMNILGKGWAYPVSPDVKGNIKFSRYEKSIEESIRIILNTTPGERLMRPDFGCTNIPFASFKILAPLREVFGTNLMSGTVACAIRDRAGCVPAKKNLDNIHLISYF